MKLRVGNRPLDKSDFIVMVAVVSIIAFTAIVYAVIEWRYFNEWTLQKSLGIDPVWPLGVFNWVSMFVFFVIAMNIIVLGRMYIMRGNIDRAFAFIAATLISIPLFTIIHASMISFLGVDAVEWGNWMYVTRIAFLPGWYVPGWWILIIATVLMATIWVGIGLALARARRR